MKHYVRTNAFVTLCGLWGSELDKRHDSNHREDSGRGIGLVSITCPACKKALIKLQKEEHKRMNP